MNSVNGLDWTEVISLDEFRGILERFTPNQLRKLREQLVEKAQAISADLLVPRQNRSGRNGATMTMDEYATWRTRAQEALGFTEKQLTHVNHLLWQEAGRHALSKPVLRRILDLAEQQVDMGLASIDEQNAVRNLRHYLGASS